MEDRTPPARPERVATLITVVAMLAAACATGAPAQQTGATQVPSIPVATSAPASLTPPPTSTPTIAPSPRDVTAWYDGVEACLNGAAPSVGLILYQANLGIVTPEPQPGMTWEQDTDGLALIIPFDTDDEARTTVTTAAPFPWFSQGQTEARANVFVYVASKASSKLRSAVDSCVDQWAARY